MVPCCVWSMGPTALLRSTIRARGYKRNLVTKILVELTRKCFWGVNIYIVPPPPRKLGGFELAAICVIYFEDFQTDLGKMTSDIELIMLDITGQVSERGLADQLGSDKIHWSDKGRALIRIVLSCHIVTTNHK